jgi:hypothetical protein
MKSGCFKMLALVVLGIVAAFGLTSCETASPATRAQQNPGVLESLSAEDRDLVLKGTIAEGMSKDAVLIAWGRPDRVTSGSAGGRATETWSYTSMRPIYRPHYGLGLGYGSYGHHGYRHRHFYPSASFGMGPDYIPVTSSVVRFRGNRVIAWETADVR